MSCPLSICTYNVNGLERVRQYARNTYSGVLEALGADIVCFQETKMSHADLWPTAFSRIADVPGWDSYFCFTRKGSYSGVATYARTAATTVRAAEEGLLRILPPQNPVCAAVQHTAAAASHTLGTGVVSAVKEGGRQHNAADARLSASWPQEITFPEAELRAMFTAEEAVALDKDGRCIITDHGLFVLFNCYFHACSGNNGLEQIEIKRNMWRALDVRMRALLAAGRHVVLAGDFNVVLPWWGEHSPVVRGSSLHQRAHSISTTSTATASQHRQQQVQQQQEGDDVLEYGRSGGKQQEAAEAAGVLQQQQPQQDQRQEAATPSGQEPDTGQVAGLPGLQDCVPEELHSSQQGLAAVQGQVQEQCAAVDQAGPEQEQTPRSLPPVNKEDNFAPHAHFRRGKPVLPSSGTAEWLLELLEPETPTNSASTNPGSTHDSSNLSASNSTAALDATAPGLRGLVPRAGVLIDTLKHLNPGVKLFRYPDAKKPGCFKERPPYTNWSQYHGIRNDQHGARGDYIFVADAADYADKVKGLLRLQETPQAPQQQQQQHLQPQLQQPPDQDLVHQARGISLSSALSAAFILRELRWTDHAPVVLQFNLPPQAAALLHSPPADLAPGPGSQEAVQQSLRQPAAHTPPPTAAGPTCNTTGLADSSAAAAAANLDVPVLPTLGIRSSGSQGIDAADAPGRDTTVATERGLTADVPCPLSTYWLTHQSAAGAAAASVLAAAGVSRPPPEVITCNVLQLLRHSQHAAAVELIRTRAEQLYLPRTGQPALLPQAAGQLPESNPAGMATEEGCVSGSAAAVMVPPGGLARQGSTQHQQQGVASSDAAAAAAGVGALGGSSAAAEAAACGPGSIAQDTGSQLSPTLPAAPQGRWQQQHHRRASHQATAAGSRMKQQQRVQHAGSKRKGRGWRVVDIGNGCTATVACSSSEDSD